MSLVPGSLVLEINCIYIFFLIFQLYVSTVWAKPNKLNSPQFEEEKNDDEDMKSEKGIDINQCLKLFTEEEMLGKFYFQANL